MYDFFADPLFGAPRSSGPRFIEPPEAPLSTPLGLDLMLSVSEIATIVFNGRL